MRKERQRMEINLKLKHYFVTELVFDYKSTKFNYNVDFKEMKSHFEKKVSTKGDNEVLISLRFVHELEDNYPFVLKVTVNGIFEMEKWKSSKKKEFVMLENTTAILFPYLRTLVGDLTLQGFGKAFIIPVMNTYALFNNPANEEINESQK